MKVAALRQALSDGLAPELSELLVPLISWRIAARRVNAVLPNPVWYDVFQHYAAPILEPFIDANGRELVVLGDLVEDTDSGLRRRGFDEFLRDPGNEFAVSACRRICAEPGLEHNPLYLHGPAGCGKTHLVDAVAAEYRELIDDDAVVILDGPSFVNRVAQELAARDDSPLRQRLQRAALIAIDGIDALGERQVAQEELFHLINQSLDNGQQLLLTGQAAPHRLRDFEERLTTRLSWGLAVTMETPRTETRLALLQRLAGTAAEDLDGMRLATLVDQQAPDMHHIVRIAARIRQGEDVTAQAGSTSFDRIVEAVSRHYQLRPADIAGKRQQRGIVRARQAALLLGRRLTQHNLVALGGMVGGRDHATVIYSIRQAEKRLTSDQTFADDIQHLTQTVLNAGE